MLDWKTDFYMAFVFLMMGVFTYIQSQKIPDTPAEFPILIAICLFIAAFIQMFMALARRGIKAEKVEHKIRPVIIITAMTAIYIFLISYVGYLLSTVLLVYFVIAVLGYKPKKQMLLISCLATLIIFVMFKVVLRVPLPMGILGGF